MAMSLMVLAPVQTAHAQSTCAAAWSASTVYTGGQTASENGTNYVANWWTQGNDPATNSDAKIIPIRLMRLMISSGSRHCETKA